MKKLLILVLCLGLVGCATASYREAMEFQKSEDYEEAYAAMKKAL